MAAIPEATKRLCEDPMVESPLWPGSRKVETPSYSLWFGPAYYPGLVVALRLRLAGADIAETVHEVRDRLRHVGLRRAGWFVGTSATPDALRDELLALGLRDDEDAVLGGLVLAEPPQGAPDDVVVERISSLEDFERFYRIQQSAFEVDDETTEEGARFIDEIHAEDAAATFITTYLAYVDGHPVATARATFAEAGVVCNGGSTLHTARGRGAYRALVVARWDDAVARGTPYLTTLARPSSYPILKQMGFVDACEVASLVDEF
jgi:hypothetical protein